VRATLDNTNTSEGEAPRSTRRSLSLATLILLWLAVPLALVVMERALTGG
jgi:hypothetical protein